MPLRGVSPINIPGWEGREREIHPFHCWWCDWEQGRLLSPFLSKTGRKCNSETYETGEKGDYSCLKVRIPYWFISLFGNHRSPPVCYFRTGMCTSSMRNTVRGTEHERRLSTLRGTAPTLGIYPMVRYFLINNVHERHADAHQRGPSKG